jgi:hypothetical protein
MANAAHQQEGFKLDPSMVRTHFANRHSLLCLSWPANDCHPPRRCVCVCVRASKPLLEKNSCFNQHPDAPRRWPVAHGMAMCHVPRIRSTSRPQNSTMPLFCGPPCLSSGHSALNLCSKMSLHPFHTPHPPPTSASRCLSRCRVRAPTAPATAD